MASDPTDGSSAPPLAVVGLSALFPGSQDAASFWRDILAGRDLITDVPPTHWLIEDYYDPDPQAPDKTYARRGAFLSPIEFDPLEHGVPPNVVPATDSSQLLALIAAKQVLDDATSGQWSHVDRERTSIILGVTSGQELLVEMGARLQRPVWVKALREHGLPEPEVQAVCDRIAASYVPWQENTFPGLLGNVVAGRIANRLNLGGTNCITDAACASSLSALQMGAHELYLGLADMVIVGGVETFNDIFMYMCFSKTPALSPSGDCRPFASGADGTMLGEGIGMLALRRLADAERDGDRIYAVVRGIGSSSDGRNKSVYAPVPEGQAKALRRAYAAARYSPATVELVEAHGTGTKAGDLAEFEGLRQVFEETGRTDREWCALGSVKSQVGHTKAAAGAAGLFKIVMALHHKLLPPTIKVDEPHPGLAIDTTPFYLNTRARPWIRGADHPRRASVSSFGFGGSNFHVTAAEYDGRGARPARTAAWPAELLLLSAADPSSLGSALRELLDEATLPGVLPALARECQKRFDPRLPARLAVVAADLPDFRTKALAAAESIRGDPERPFSAPSTHYALAAATGKLAFLFPGQGSQYLEMGQDLAMTFDAARAAWDRAASSALDPPLHEVVFPRPAFRESERERLLARLTATEWAQPAIGVTSTALLGLLRQLGLEADAFAGHSFGEVTALHAAGALDFEAFLRVARRRGELMAEAAQEPGAMLAVSGSIEAVRRAISEPAGRVVVANHNGPRQVVLSGATSAIEAAEGRLRENGLTSRRLPVATAFHSPLVAAACAPFAEFLRGVAFSAASRPVFSNAEAARYEGDAEAVRARLAGQITQPVRFVEMIDALYAEGVRTFVEVGPGAVLTGLVGECLGARPHAAVGLDRKGQHGITSLWNGLGRLAVQGARLDFAALLAPFAAPNDPRARKKPGLALLVSGANYAKPYPPAGGAAALPPPNPPRPHASPDAPRALQRALPEARTQAPSLTPQALAAAPAADAPAWADAYQQVQRQTAEAHEVYLKTMAESHAAFLKAAETSLLALDALRAGRPLEGRPATAEDVPPAAALHPAAAVQHAAAPPVSVASQPAEHAAEHELRSLLLGVVAEKTGYPADVLSLEMDLESDLGIDSIKRVEIFATLQQRRAGLPEVKASEMASLRSLGQVLTFLERSGTAGIDRGTRAVAAQDAAPGNGDLKALLLSVVAEKTGYPADMLSLEMELEGDLGIDSIKRVEILAAMQERVPGLPEVKPAEVAALRTLGQIVARIHDGGERALPPKPSPRAEPPVRSSSEQDAAVLHRLAVGLAEAPPLGASLRGLFSSGPVYVTDEGAGVAPALARRLRAHGLPSSAVGELPKDARAVICLEGLRAIASPEQALAVNRNSFEIARALAPQLADEGGVFVTVQDTGGDFGLTGREPLGAWTGGLTGLVKTAALEWPLAGLRAIDVERAGRDAEAISAAIAEELLAGGAELEVGLRADGRRFTLACTASPPEAAAATLDERSVIVASGGGRGVTAACLIELARQRRPKLALLGRTALLEEPAALRGVLGEAELYHALLDAERTAGRSPAPAELRARVQELLARREIRGTLEALAAAGSKAVYVTADVASPQAVRAALAEVRRELGPISGIVHGAGVIADKPIAQKTVAQWESVFETKVLGLRSLLDATAEDPVSLLCVFSSVAGRFGNQGQADYAMANEVLSKVAASEARRRGPGCLVKALHWGPWDGGMVNPALKAHFQSRGTALLPLEAGAKQFVRELLGMTGSASVEAVIAAGPATPPRGERQLSLEFHVSAATHAFLEGHRLGGTPVVPVVLALEWLARSAAALRPDLALSELIDVRVQRGIRLERFESGGDTFRVTCHEKGNGSRPRLSLEIRSAGGILHYSAAAEMAEALPSAREIRVPTSPLEPAPWPDGRLYPELLFHEGSFRVIRTLEGLSERAAAAIVAGVDGRGWSKGPWQIDAAALDGGLQLAILLGHHAMGQPSLPTRIGRLRLFHRGTALGDVRCRIAAKEVSPLRTLSDIWFTDQEGRLLAEMSDVEMHALPVHAQAGEPERAEPVPS